MLNPSQWPLDVATLKKGDVIPEKMMAVLADERPSLAPSFNHAFLSVWTEIDRQLRALERDWTFEREGNALVIHDDKSASKLNDRRQRLARAALRRCHRKQNAVDERHLDAEEVRAHRRSLAITGAFLVAGEEAKHRVVGLLNYERNTPGLLRLPGAG